MTRAKWNKQRVIAAIRQRQQQGLSMRGVKDDDGSLFDAAVRYCGGWHKALVAAGLPSKPKRRWTRDLVLTAVWAWHQERLSKGWTRDSGLIHAAMKHFGSWRKALVAAGIPVQASQRWTRERVSAALPASGSQRSPPRRGELAPVLVQAACRIFPTWHDALAAAGLVPREPRPAARKVWTVQLVLEAIRARHQQGLSLAFKADRALSAAAKHRFGSWSKALATAGRPVRHYRRWSQERVLEQLRCLHQQGAFAESTRLRDSGLVRAASLRFGGWRRALRLAGILAPDENWRHKRSWTRQRVIEAIQDLHVRGIPLNSKKNKILAAAARRRFGSWHAARAAAGLPVNKENGKQTCRVKT
jgi:hypothetical protein